MIAKTLTKLLRGNRQTIPKRYLFTEFPFSEVTSKEKFAVRGRKWLVGGDGVNMPRFIQNDNAPEAKAFVLKDKHTSDIKALSNSIKDIIETSFTRYSALLFKKLPLNTAQDFAELLNGVGYPRVNYLSGSAFRTDHGDNVYDASLEPPEITVELHNEMAYHTMFPSQVTNSGHIKSAFVSCHLKI